MQVGRQFGGGGMRDGVGMLHDGFQRQLAGNLPLFMPAHAISHREHGLIARSEKTVLVGYRI